jgi:hypothetical protein
MSYVQKKIFFWKGLIKALEKALEEEKIFEVCYKEKIIEKLKYSMEFCNFNTYIK